MFVTSYVIVAVPALTPEIIPEASTVATLLLLDVQVPPVVAEENSVVPPSHTFVAPVIAATTGNGFTVTLLTAFAVHPAEVPVTE